MLNCPRYLCMLLRKDFIFTLTWTGVASAADNDGGSVIPELVRFTPMPASYVHFLL